jgi:hypothetical protein
VVDAVFVAVAVAVAAREGVERHRSLLDRVSSGQTDDDDDADDDDDSGDDADDADGDDGDDEGG